MQPSLPLSLCLCLWLWLCLSWFPYVVWHLFQRVGDISIHTYFYIYTSPPCAYTYCILCAAAGGSRLRVVPHFTLGMLPYIRQYEFNFRPIWHPCVCLCVCVWAAFCWQCNDCVLCIQKLAINAFIPCPHSPSFNASGKLCLQSTESELHRWTAPTLPYNLLRAH